MYIASITLAEPNNFEEKISMLDSRFEPAAPFTEAEISEIEKILGRGLPNDYCEFVNTYGGAFVGGLVDGDPNLPVLAFFGTEKECLDAILQD